MQQNIIAAEINEEFIAALRVELDEKKAATMESCKAYLADIETKQGRIKAQAEKYTEELAKLEAMEKKQGAAVAQAVAKGDRSQAEKAEAELDKIADKIAATKKKSTLMTGATAKGEPALYSKAKADMEATAKAAEEYRENLERLRDKAKDEVKRLEKIIDSLGQTLGYGGYGYWGRPNFAGNA